MKKLIRNIIWYCYYVYDSFKCTPHKGKVKRIDNEIAENVSKCIARRKPKKIIIFAAYGKKPDDEYISFFLQGVGHALTIVINNTEENKCGVEYFGESLIWVNRPNFGRDIAAYKLGIHSVVKSELKSIEDLALVNDSSFILKESFFNFFKDNFPEDVLAHSYSQTPFPHVRSYLLRIKQPLLDELNSYLMNFPMTKSRYNAVINGEIGISKAVFMKYKIGLWAYSGIFNGELKNNKINSLDLFTSNDFSIIVNFKNDQSISRASIRNFLNDPYQLSRNSFPYIPDVIKREVFEKRLATKEMVYFVIENSELTMSLKRKALTDILISKRHLGIKNILKMRIGEI